MIWAMLFFTGIVSSGQLDFELVNNTAYEWRKVWIAKDGTDRWSANLLGQPLAENAVKHVTGKSEFNSWQLRIEYREPYGKKTRPRWELFNALELQKYRRIEVSVVEGEKWDAHYEMR